MEGIRIVCPYASCNDCCIVHSTSAGADPELVGGGGGGGWSCMLLLHPTPTCTAAGPDLCTLHPDHCTLWLSLAQILHLHTWWFQPLQLAPVVFFLSPTGSDTKLALGQPALCGGGIYMYIINAWSVEEKQHQCKLGWGVAAWLQVMCVH